MRQDRLTDDRLTDDKQRSRKQATKVGPVKLKGSRLTRPVPALVLLLTILSLMLLPAVLLTACAPASTSENIDLFPATNSQATTGSSSSQVRKLRIALVMKTLTNPFFIDMEKGARQAEAENNIELIVKTGAKETSIEQQINIVDEMIASRVDAIVIAPGSSTDLIPVLKKAQDAGIPIVNIDNRLDPALCLSLGLQDVPFVSVDNEKGAWEAAQVLASSVTIPTQAVIIEGISDTDNSLNRVRGARRAFAANPQIELIATVTANWKIDEAYNVTRQLFEKHPDIGLIFCANDMMALGVIQYLKSSRQTGVQVAGFDALAEARQAIKAGTLVATVDQQAALQGYTGIQYALKLINNQTVPPETLLDTRLITADNAQD